MSSAKSFQEMTSYHGVVLSVGVFVNGGQNYQMEFGRTERQTIAKATPLLKLDRARDSMEMVI